MKYFLFIILLLVSLESLAQDSYQTIKNIVNSSVKTYAKNGKVSSNLNKVILNFNQYKKIDIKDLKKNQVGVCIVLSEDNSDLSFSPAKYTYADGKVNISAIRSKSTGGLSDDMKDYVQRYLTKIESLGSNKLFRNLILKKFDTEGVITENKAEFIVNEPNTLSFVRGDKDWMLIMSIDNEYKELENPRIIIYAFKMSFSGKNIFSSSN